MQAVTLADWDSKQVLEEIKAALAQNALDEKRLTALAFVPVMSRSDERIEVISEAVKVSHQVADSAKRADIQAILFAFANKFLSGKELERIEEEIVMTQLSQMIYEDGIKVGRQKGIEKGIEKERLTLARKLLDVLSDEMIAKKTELPLDLVKTLRQESLGKI